MTNTLTTPKVTKLEAKPLVIIDVAEPIYSDEIKTEIVDLVERAMAIEQVVNEKTQEVAYGLLSEVNDKLNVVEKVRVAIKDPFLKKCQKIEADTKDLVGDEKVKSPKIPTLHSAKAYLKGIIGKFQEEQQRKKEEAERAAEAERQRIAREAAALEEQKRIAEAAGNAEALDELKLQESVLQHEAVAATQVIEPPKPVGMSVTQPWVFEVVGATPEQVQQSLIALANHNPNLVKIEVRANEVNRLIRERDGQIVLPGLTIKREVKVR